MSMDDPVLNTHVVKTILNNYMWSCPVEELNVKILSIVCPFLKQSIFQIFDDIEKKLDDLEVMKDIESTTFDGQFIDIKNLLGRWQEILEHVIKIEKTPSNVKSLLETLPSVVIKICNHCKNKREKYLKRSLPLLLQDIYRDICSIVKSYCTLFSKSFKFNVNSNEDLETLKIVLTGLGDMAPCTAYGMSTMVQTWKAFKFMANFSSFHLWKKKDCVDLVRGYFKSIGNNIIRLWKNIMMRPETEFISRAKCSNLLLDIFAGLHTFYCSDKCPFPLEYEFVRDMVPVLIEFIAHFEFCHAWNFDGSKCWKRDKIFTTNWPRMLLDYYKNSEHFLPIFHAQSKEIKNIKDPDYAIGFHCCLLHHNIFDKLEVLDMALENMNYIQVELMEKNFRISNWGTAEGGMRDASIYEYTLALLCNLFNFVGDANAFTDCEHILLKHLLSEHFWPSLLAHDILIHCYTCSNKDVALIHMQYFTMAYETLHERQNNSLAVKMLGIMIREIYKLLPKKKLEEFLKKCESPVALQLILTSNIKIKIRDKPLLVAAYKKLTSAVTPSGFSETIANLELQPCVKNWSQFTNSLRVMGIEQENRKPELTDTLLEITTCALQTVEEFDENKKQRMMYDLILILFNCARIYDTNKKIHRFDWRLFTALSKGLFEIIDVPENFLIKICHYLTNNADCLIGSIDDSDTTTIPDVFIHLLENDSKLVHQEALECFDKIVEKSSEEFVKGISNAIAKRPMLCNTVPAYLKKELFPKPGNGESMPQCWRSYLSLSSHFNDFSVSHKCYEGDECGPNKKRLKLCGEPLEERVHRLSKELIELTCENIDTVPVDAAEKLKNACRLFIEGES